jgi:hypothetical protein
MKWVAMRRSRFTWLALPASLAALLTGPRYESFIHWLDGRAGF